MKVYWWQRGVHLDPESREERSALYAITESLKQFKSLKVIHLRDKVRTGDVIIREGNDEEPIVSVEQSSETVS